MLASNGSMLDSSRPVSPRTDFRRRQETDFLPLTCFSILLHFSFTGLIYRIAKARKILCLPLTDKITSGRMKQWSERQRGADGSGTKRIRAISRMDEGEAALNIEERYRSGHNGAASKADGCQSHVGSNPTLSAIRQKMLHWWGFQGSSNLRGPALGPTFLLQKLWFKDTL